MKKILIFFTVFILFSPYKIFAQNLQGSVIKDEVLPVPQWDEFCSPGYMNAVYKEPSFFNTIFPFSISNIRRIHSNYWFNRKQQFERQVNYCQLNVSSEYKKNCYENLRQSEYNKTQIYMKSIPSTENVNLNIKQW